MGHYFSTVGTNYVNNIPSTQTSIKDYLKVIPRNSNSIFFTPTNAEEVKSLISKLPNKKTVDLII